MDSWLDRYRLPLTVALVTLVLTGGVAWHLRQPAAAPLEVAEPTATAAASIKVYVSGAVVQPGVYTLLEDERVEDALKAAGGPLPEADLESINLAVKLRDEMQVRVPYRPESPPSGTPPVAQASSAEGLNLNTATQAELEALPGIGPVTAGKILAYRAEHGGFRNVEELLDAKLVNRSTFEKIREAVMVR